MNSNPIRGMHIQERGLRSQKGRPEFGLETKGVSSRPVFELMKTEDFAVEGGHHHHYHSPPSKIGDRELVHSME